MAGLLNDDYTDEELLRSEIGTVEGFLGDLPEDEVIERKSWESRLEVLREKIKRC